MSAQTPRPLGQPTVALGKPNGASGKPTGAIPMFDPAQIGDRVTVIEARPGRDVAGSGDLIGFSHVDGSGTQVITLVDTEKAWMAVYHVGSSGEIRLVSSRAIDADFTLQLNATSPTPEDIRRLQGVSPRR